MTKMNFVYYCADDMLNGTMTLSVEEELAYRRIVDLIYSTGNKLEDKSYFRHSGYHGGLKETSLKDMLDTYPDRVIRNAVKGMLPKNIPGTRMLSRLKIYSDETHPHQAQFNAKNS